MARRYHRRKEDGTFELQLTSMIDIFTIMVFFLLSGFSAVALSVVILDAQIPQPVQQALEKDREKKERQVTVAVNIQESKALEVLVTTEGKGQQRIVIHPIKSKDDSKNMVFDLDRLHKEIVAIKTQNVNLFRIDLNPSTRTSYKEIISVMDQVRQTRQGDPDIFIIDEKTKQKVKTNLMFPDVVFSNVLEG